jgi:hypothetical protein
MVTIELVLRGIALLLGASALVNLVASWLLVRRLRQQHVDFWRNLGEPRLTSPRFGRIAGAVRRVAWGNGSLQELGDPQLLFLQRITTVTGYSALVLFASYWLVVVLNR